MRRLEDSLRCLALSAKFPDPGRAIAFRIAGIEKSNPEDFIKRSFGILRAIGIIGPETKRTHYRQHGPEDMDGCPHDVLAAIALRIVHENSLRILGISVEQLASELATVEKRKQ